MVIDSTKGMTKFVFVGGKDQTTSQQQCTERSERAWVLDADCQHLACFCDYWAEPGLLSPSGPFWPCTKLHSLIFFGLHFNAPLLCSHYISNSTCENVTGLLFRYIPKHDILGH